MEKFNVLGDLYKILMRQVERSGLPITLLCVGVLVSFNLRQADKKELTEAMQLYKLETGIEIKALRSQIESCNEERFKAYREIATLKTQVEFLTARTGRK